ncbi:unnamed protein product [Paramecium octaurelia]|uniref:Uncharacterized protein n=1 Tax=Paramecium octaurelia TaxID=43137 RepID=A0A8S1XCQ6_PAROT|nr:unnamed protein product [Paramecium octaurelia]
MSSIDYIYLASDVQVFFKTITCLGLQLLVHYLRMEKDPFTIHSLSVRCLDQIPMYYLIDYLHHKSNLEASIFQFI